MLIENIAWFLFGAGVMAIILGLITMLNMRRRTSAFDAMINDLKMTSKILDEIVQPSAVVGLEVKTEIGRLMFRDKDGKLETVNLIFDPALDGYVTQENPEGDFVFSAKMLEKTREDGIEPDDVVSSILRASGRML